MTAPVTITFEAAPQAKARPRFGRYGVYTPTQTRSFETR